MTQQARNPMEFLRKLQKFEELSELQQWWVECREVHRWIISNQPVRYAAQMSIIEIKSAAKRTVLNWKP